MSENPALDATPVENAPVNVELDADPIDFNPTYDPTRGALEATQFPPDDFPDPDQTPVDQGNNN